MSYIESNIIPSALIQKFSVPDNILKDIDDYAEQVLEEKKYHSQRNATPFLAADVFSQFFLNIEEPRVGQYVAWQNDLVSSYIKEYQKLSQIDYPDCHISTEDIWSVHSKEGDYNPIHSHNVKTGFGLATVTWTKLPPSMNTHKPDDEKTYQSYGLFKGPLDGVADGYLSLQANVQKPIRQMQNFEFSQQIMIRPVIGLMIMFPLWMNHLVYPFRGEGERRSIASNIVIEHKDHGNIF